MKDGFTGKCKQKTLNRSVKAIKTTSKNTNKKEKHLVSIECWKSEQSKQKKLN